VIIDRWWVGVIMVVDNTVMIVVMILMGVLKVAMMAMSGHRGDDDGCTTSHHIFCIILNDKNKTDR
jgi:hypothetical protein